MRDDFCFYVFMSDVLGKRFRIVEQPPHPQKLTSNWNNFSTM